MVKEKNAYLVVDKLVELIKKTVNDTKKSGQLTPDIQTYQKWILHDFEYTDKGVKSHSASVETIREYNLDSVAQNILDVIEKNQLYQKVLQEIESVEHDEEDIVDSFAYEVIMECLENEPTDDTAIGKIKQILFKEINDEPVNSVVLIALGGIVLKSNEIKISDTISIRQTRKEDLERKISSSSFTRELIHPYPSAMMTIEDCSGSDMGRQKKEWLSIAILRLFKVASVTSIQSETSTKSLRNDFKHLTRGSSMVIHIIGVIKENEAKSLRNFWHGIVDHIPKSFFDPTIANSSSSSIAYSRYCDALLKSGPEELRIANVMMGLESIFLQGGGELSYRLRLRVAKLVSNFGHDPLQANKMIRDAYEIRSKFVHGGLQDSKSKEKLAEKYGNASNLIKKILEFLRLTIIVSISMDKSKDELISSIDESFLSETGRRKLENLLKEPREILK